MNRPPLISIGLPVYNGEAFLAETLDSLLAQTIEDVELVISDNASTDSTPEICSTYAEKDDRIRYFPNDVNVGILANFNRACLLSSGRYFKWHAADDLLAPKFLEACLEAIEANQAASIASTRVANIDEHGAPIPYDEDREMYVTTYGEEIPEGRSVQALGSTDPVARFKALLNDLTGPLHTQFIFGLMRKDRLARTPLIERYIGAEKVLMSRLAIKGPLIEVNERLFLRRFYTGHFGRSGRGSWRGKIKVTKKVAPERSFVPFPLLIQIAGYRRAIRDSDLTSLQRLRCHQGLLAKLGRVSVARLDRASEKVSKKMKGNS